MDNNLLNFLNEHKIFSHLDEELKNQLIAKFSKIELKNDCSLFRQGDPSDALYVLVSGKLSVSTVTANGQFKTLGHIEDTKIIGELAVLADKPYPYTVKALRDSIIYKLPKKEFVELCHHHSSCMFETVYPLLLHSNSIVQLPEEHPEIMTAIAPANSDVSMNAFAETLTALLKDHPNIILLSDNEIKDLEKIRQHKKSSQQIIFLLKSNQSPFAKIALKEAEKLYLVGQTSPKPYLDPEIIERIHENTMTKGTLPNLILIHPSSTNIPKHTSAWLDLTPFHMHHHIKLNEKKHFERLIRFIEDKPNGLILGGGGTRGWGHIGALKALSEKKHPIDFIGGTSVGAIIGACYATKESYEDTYKNFSAIVSTSKDSISWRSMTLPIVSIFDSKSFTNASLEVFENIMIEDTWIPYFCVSSNLTHYSEEVHRSGLLWEKTRASSSIPGLIPPMIINGEIHFDGGLLNNLPVDIMWQLIGKKGKVIGVELNSSMQDSRKYHFPPILGFKQVLSTKIGLSKEPYRFPRFMDIFLRGMLVGSSAKAKQNGQSATILVNLSLGNFRLLKYSHKQAQKMIEIGFVETLLQLHQYKNRDL